MRKRQIKKAINLMLIAMNKGTWRAPYYGVLHSLLVKYGRIKFNPPTDTPF
jgi:hypothetical protein